MLRFLGCLSSNNNCGLNTKAECFSSDRNIIEFPIVLSHLDLLICLDTVQKYVNLGVILLLLVIKPSLFLRLVIPVLLHIKKILFNNLSPFV